MENPFPEKLVEEVRASIIGTLAGDLGEMKRLGEVSPGQPFFLELIAKVLEISGVPDLSVYREDFSQVVRIGFGTELPRTPEVFEPKEKWRLPDPGEERALYKENYKSVELHRDYIEKFFEEERAEGLLDCFSE